MLNNEEVKKLIYKTEISDLESIELIKRFIWDKKGISVDIRRPDNILSIQIMNLMYNKCLEYYLNKFNNENG